MQNGCCVAVVVVANFPAADANDCLVFVLITHCPYSQELGFTILLCLVGLDLPECSMNYQRPGKTIVNGRNKEYLDRVFPNRCNGVRALYVPSVQLHLSCTTPLYWPSCSD